MNPSSSLPASAGFALEPNETVLANSLVDLADAVLITRADLAAPGPTIVAASPGMTTLTGYSTDELRGRNPRFLQGALTDHAVLQRLRMCCERGERFVGEAVNYRKDGTSYILQWTVDPIRARDGRTTHYFSLQRDVTAQRPFAREWLEAEQRARAAHEALGSHLRVVAEAILVLERTKRSFRSKELGALRDRLEQLTRAGAATKRLIHEI